MKKEISDKDKIAFVKRHGWYQDEDNLFNPKSWFNEGFPVGEESIDEVIKLIKNDKGGMKINYKRLKYMDNFATIITALGVILLFIGIWSNAWNIVRFVITGILFIMWGNLVWHSMEN